MLGAEKAPLKDVNFPLQRLHTILLSLYSLEAAKMTDFCMSHYFYYSCSYSILQRLQVSKRQQLCYMYRTPF